MPLSFIENSLLSNKMLAMQFVEMIMTLLWYGAFDFCGDTKNERLEMNITFDFIFLLRLCMCFQNNSFSNFNDRLCGILMPQENHKNDWQRMPFHSLMWHGITAGKRKRERFLISVECSWKVMILCKTDCGWCYALCCFPLCCLTIAEEKAHIEKECVATQSHSRELHWKDASGKVSPKHQGEYHIFFFTVHNWCHFMHDAKSNFYKSPFFPRWNFI